MKIIIVSQNSIRKHFLKVNGFEISNEIGVFTLYQSPTTPDVVVFSSGSTESIMKDLAALFEMFKPTFAVSVGFASSMSQSVKIGAILKFNDISAVSGPMALWNSDDALSLATPVNRPISALFETLDENRGWFYEGSLLTTPKMVRTSKMKHWISEEFHASAIDKDGFYVADVCVSQQLPYAVIRGINNDENTNSSNLIRMMDRNGHVSFWRVIVRPHLYLSYAKIHSRNVKARKNLERLLDRVLGLEIH